MTDRIRLRELQRGTDWPETVAAVLAECGHSQRPSVATHHSVLYLNLGSAGRRRFRLPVTVAKLVIKAGEVTAEIIELEV